MNNNVLILGAGFSYDAEIPLLGNFIEKMWEFYTRGKNGQIPLNENDKSILIKALDIRNELDNYHGRVSFDDRNIEDILSMLAFNVLGGTQKDKNKFENFINAISKTIELSCNVKHEGYPQGRESYKINESGSSIYRNFWKTIFNQYEKTNQIPTIITFNYDLVLERALFQFLIGTNFNQHNARAPFSGITINYDYKFLEEQHYKVEYREYSGIKNSGTILIRIDKPEKDFLKINILKLHGSLNFPKDNKNRKKENFCITKVIDNPYIIPPVSNKQSTGAGDNIWKTALNNLREAKNISFVGYSLPKTDMYMKFFLKAALGPNRELNKVFIFDPLLWKNDKDSKEMIERYSSCFSEQFRNRIEFYPNEKYTNNYKYGTTEHFVNILENNPNEILF